jgi:CBS domain-containing protein
MPATATIAQRRNVPSPAASGDYLETPVRDFMTPGVLVIAEDATLRQVYRALVAHSIHAVLVVGRNEGRPLGWVTARGLLGWIGQDLRPSPAPGTPSRSVPRPSSPAPQPGTP